MLLDHFKRNNLIALILKIMGLIVIAWGILSGIVFLVSVYDEYMGELPIGVWSVFFTPILVGFLIIGFGEVIDLLQRIFNQNEPAEKKLSLSEEPEKPNQPNQPHPLVPWQAEQEIREFYVKKGVEVDRITATKDQDIFVVEANGKVERIELGGFSPKILSE
ncbi:hypothetical protein [Sporosarcina sp. G11-34]|uniref:hypothetical protein n=1 Tax=Sporosarcina sp. G11-34 TaxID=2849605 RepID=UPI0022A8EC78|nr:hypothetical protein [Sporosarcina sp. G11-34]MCZ2259119.1 cbb3-type cytochrome c oxidase subunit I [Sporosarcina sp. G11-34]